MGKTGRKNKVYSAEFKIGVIMDMREHHLSYHETARKYWETHNHSDENHLMSTIHRWERIYLEEGAEGLMKERRGRACSTGGKAVCGIFGIVILITAKLMIGYRICR